MTISPLKMFNVPNLITAGNMLCGVFAILLALAGRIDIAPYFIFLGAILDFLDGFFARILNQQGEFGKQLDSLADMITFGLAPGIIMLVVIVISIFSPDNFYHLNLEFASELGTGDKAEMYISAMNLSFSSWVYSLHSFDNPNLLPFIALIITFFSMFRLAKFNIDTRQSDSFIGLPTPANTIFFMSFPLLLAQYGGTTGWEHDLILWLVQPLVLIPIICIMSVLLVSEIPLFALKFKHYKWAGNKIRYSFLISCGLLIPILLFWAIPIIVILYLLLSIIQNSIQKNKPHEIQS